MNVQFDSNTEILFETRAPVMFSPLERKLGLSMQWKPWKARSFSIGENCTLMYRKGDKNSPISGICKLTKVDITEMSSSVEPEAGAEKENGIVVVCQDMHGYETSFRCILNDDELYAFKDTIRLVAKEHNADNLHRSSISDHIRPVSPTKHAGSSQSVMRRAVARAMDLYDVRSIKERTVARRGAMKYLPVLFSNDLVHGSWWFTIGSILFTATSVFILWNSFTDTLGEDDSQLDGYHYRATWIFMIISGVFCTLGSMAFMRAVHEDPPMKPLFPAWYHMQNDELLGSWLVLLANVPVVPYSLIYLSKDRTNWVYMGSLVVSVVLVIGSSLFVQACYPSDKPRRKIIQPAAFFCCYCFCSKAWMRTHLSNDWLAGCWFIFWGTLMATLVCLVLALMAFADHNMLQCFIYGTALLETVCFSIGSAYFVTGSYPEGSLVAGDNDYWVDFHPQEEQFTAENPFFSDAVGLDRPVGTSHTVVGYAPVPLSSAEEEAALSVTLLENDQLHHY